MKNSLCIFVMSLYSVVNEKIVVLSKAGMIDGLSKHRSEKIEISNNMYDSGGYNIYRRNVIRINENKFYVSCKSELDIDFNRASVLVKKYMRLGYVSDVVRLKEFERLSLSD